MVEKIPNIELEQVPWANDEDRLFWSYKFHRQVFDMTVKGLSNLEIAERLNVFKGRVSLTMRHGSFIRRVQDWMFGEEIHRIVAKVVHQKEMAQLVKDNIKKCSANILLKEYHRLILDKLNKQLLGKQLQDMVLDAYNKKKGTQKSPKDLEKEIHKKFGYEPTKFSDEKTDDSGVAELSQAKDKQASAD